MNDELDTMIKNIQQNVSSFELSSATDEVTVQKTSLAKELQFQLTMMKLLVGIQSFDELPYFSRQLKNVTEYIDKADKEHSASMEGDVK